MQPPELPPGAGRLGFSEPVPSLGWFKAAKSSSCSLHLSSRLSSAHLEEPPGCQGQVALNASAPSCPLLFPSYAPPWKRGEDGSPCFQAVGRTAAAAAPACCLADGEIISKPFPFSTAPPLLLQDHAGRPCGAQSAEPAAEAGQLAQLSPSMSPSDPHLSWGKGLLGSF